MKIVIPGGTGQVGGRSPHHNVPPPRSQSHRSLRYLGSALRVLIQYCSHDPLKGQYLSHSGRTAAIPGSWLVYI